MQEHIYKNFHIFQVAGDTGKLIQQLANVRNPVKGSEFAQFQSM